MKPCIHRCGREVGDNSETGECTPCRSGYRYWRKKTVGERNERRKKLDVLSSRLDTHFDTGGKENKQILVQPAPKTLPNKVVHLRERRRA